MNTLIESLEQKKQELNLQYDEELAEFIGIEPSAYSRLKSGERWLTQEQAQKIIKVFPDLYGLVGSILLQKPNKRRE